MVEASTKYKVWRLAVYCQLDLPCVPKVPLIEPYFDAQGGRQDRLRVSNDMEVGRAGEYLVLADLVIQGWVAYPTAQGMPYDIAVDLGDQTIRVQVKTTQRPRTAQELDRKNSPLYVFSTRRAGRGGRRRYGLGEFDVLALVALDRRLIAYYDVASSHNDSIAIRVPGVRYGPGGVVARHFDEAEFDVAVQCIRERTGRGSFEEHY